MTQNLDLAPIGNCTISSLVDRCATHVWCCAPRVDGDPIFCTLLDDGPASRGCWAIDSEGAAKFEQTYIRNTAVLRTRVTLPGGGAFDIIDFAPRFRQSGRIYRPGALVRLLRPVSGAPRIRIRLWPASEWGAQQVQPVWGSNHIRYQGAAATFRLTTNCAVSHIIEERLFRLEEDVALFFGPDEPFIGDVLSGCLGMLRQTEQYWQEWVRTLALPLEWQAAVIRAAITLKLCAYEETGAIVAALTTSVPEHAHSGRNWDYRYCWLRDAYYVVTALNRLGAADMLENYLGYLRNIVDQADGGHIQPVYGVGMEAALPERIIESLPGYRGMGPVRAGNQAHEHLQHDVYGQVVLSNVQAFFDQRLLRPATIEDFEALERVGDRAFALHDKPDAGLWEFRTIARVHTYSSLLCWAACDRLGNAAQVLGLVDRAEHWRWRAAQIRQAIESEAWNAEAGRFAASFGGTELDASLLQLVDLQFLEPGDPRFITTLESIERDLKRGSHLLRYGDPDDFGAPETAFNFCTFWFIEALHLAGRTEEARAMFEEMLEHRTHSGLLSEDIAFSDAELWGNYPQTYSLVGIINCAVQLSRPWRSVR
jgi:hypothetical protein